MPLNKPVSKGGLTVAEYHTARSLSEYETKGKQGRKQVEPPEMAIPRRRDDTRYHKSSIAELRAANMDNVMDFRLGNMSGVPAQNSSHRTAGMQYRLQVKVGTRVFLHDEKE